MAERDRKKLSNKLNVLLEGIYLLKDGDGYPISETFQRLPLRKLVDYYKIVTNPISLHGIGRSIKNFKYNSSQEFVNDLAQVTWNARLYNVKGSAIYNHALILDAYVREKVIPKLGDVYYPNLGELPDTDDVGLQMTRTSVETPVGAMSGHEDEFDEHEDKKQFMEMGSPTPLPGLMAGGGSLSPNIDASGAGMESMNSTSGYKLNQGLSPYGNQSLQNSQSAASGIRRGRPPIIDKPFETRIKLILKQFKKLRHPNDPNYPLTTNFDRLPDPKYSNQYYSIIKNPISLFEIRTKVRTRKYRTVDEFIADLGLMFQNTKFYYQNDQGSQILQEALLFESEANKVISMELAKPEKELLTANTPGGDGIIRIPLDSIEVNGYNYQIGDWVLIKNANDPQRPTVGQIFRLWATEDGTRYTNVCWYYRPEQTCHRVDRLFYSNEVCKTGQYRDHLASEIVGPCYVVFFSRYVKNDLPDGIVPQGSPWFICEFRYNENSHVFNRIRTWKACLPDEIRDKPEHTLVPLHEPRRLIKYDSPLKNLLPAGADANMQILEPTPGPLPNTPPLVGSVYLRGSADDDELGQYKVSPNVVRSPENDNTTDGRNAYLFTPPSQLKSGGHINVGGPANVQSANIPIGSTVGAAGGLTSHVSHVGPVSNMGETTTNNSGLNTPTTFPLVASNPPVGNTPLNSGTTGFYEGSENNQVNKSGYATSMSIYQQQMQQQEQQQQQQLQQQRYAPVNEIKRGMNAQTAILPETNQIVPPSYNGAAAAATAATAATTTTTYGNQYQHNHVNAALPTQISKYSDPEGGVLAYTTVDTEGILGVSEGINSKRRKGENGQTINEIVWFRAPPILVTKKILAGGSEGELGHSAKYLAWKIKQGKV